MINKKLEAMIPAAQLAARRFLRKLDAAGLKYVVIETIRTADTQAAYYAQGREKLDVVNGLREKAGLEKITEAQNKNIITKAKYSQHQSGRAIDIVPLKNDKPLWVIKNQDDAELFLTFGAMGEAEGFTCGVS